MGYLDPGAWNDLMEAGGGLLRDPGPEASQAEVWTSALFRFRALMLFGTHVEGLSRGMYHIAGRQAYSGQCGFMVCCRGPYESMLRDEGFNATSSKLV